jgi:hypothetical protein
LRPHNVWNFGPLDALVPLVPLDPLDPLAMPAFSAFIFSYKVLPQRLSTNMHMSLLLHKQTR